MSNRVLPTLIDQETLELLLNQVLSQRESHKLAKDCLQEFKDHNRFLSASPKELERAGLNSSCIFWIKFLHELPAEMLRKKVVQQPFYQSSSEIFDYLYYSMRDLKKEVLKVIYLDNANRIIDTVDLFEGTLESIPVRPREIIESALAHVSSAIIFVHNHPAGDPAPSKSDKQFTRDIVFISSAIQLKLLDHIIIGGDSYFSFADEGLIKKYEIDFLTFRIRRL